MTDRTTNLILKAQVDQGSADAGVRALQQLQANADQARDSFTNIFKGMSNTAEEIQQLNDAADAISFTGRSLDEATKAADQNAEAISNLRQQYIDAADAAAKLKDEQPDGSNGGGFSPSSLRMTGRALDQLGLSGVGRPIQQIGDIGLITKQIDELSTGFKTLPGILGEAATEGTALAGSMGGLLAVLGPVAVAVGATTLAWKVFISDALAPANKALDEARMSVDAYYSAIGKGTTDSLQKQLADLEKQKKDVDDKAATINNALANGFTSAQQQFGDFGARLITAATSAGAFGGGVQGVEKDLDAAKQQSDDFASKIDGLKRALGDSTVAANDAAEAERKLQDARAQAADKAIAQAVQDEQLRQTGTSKGIQSRVGDIEAERGAIFDQLNQGGLSTDKVKELNQRLADLSDEENKLTNDILPAVEAREAEDKAAKDAQKSLDEFTKSMSELGKITAEISKMESDRARQVAQEQADDQRNAQRAAVEKDYQQRIDAAKREETEQAERDKVAAADAQATVKFNDDKAKIDANFFDGQLKAYQNYIDAEKTATDRANLQRLQTLEKAQLDLKQLAATGDVAGFVSRSDQAKLDLKNQSENETLADQQRREQFDKQTQANQENYQKQLNDLNVSFAREKDARDQAAEQRIQQIEDSGKEANTKSAQLEQELNNIREQWRRDDLQRQRDLEEQSYEERLQVQQDKQREILAQTGTFFDQWINDIAQQAQSVLQQAQAATPADNTTMTPEDIQLAQQASDYMNRIDSGDQYQTFASGLPYVPQDNYRASLDLGERVLTARQNQDYTYGAGRGVGDTINVTVQNTVGDIATKSMLDDYQNTTIDGMKQAYRQAKGKGSS